MSPEDSLLHYNNLTKRKTWILRSLTGVFPGTERTLFAPGDARQTATFSVCGSALLDGICTHVIPLKPAPANIHVHIMIRIDNF